MIRREPEVYAKFADGMEPGPDNALGSRALYLYLGDRDTYLRIHGTPFPTSIGSRASSGCVRMSCRISTTFMTIRTQPELARLPIEVGNVVA